MVIIPGLKRRTASLWASTLCHAATSTPNVSFRPCVCAPRSSSPDISVIDRSVSGPILVSDASIADLDEHFKKCFPSKNSFQKDSTNSSCSQKASPKRPVLPKKESVHRCVHIQIPETTNKSACIEELYFNDEAKKSGNSSPRGHCINEVCQGTREILIPVCSSMTKIEKEVTRRSCGRSVKDSAGTCSLVDSANATCDAATRAAYYQNKLLSAQQILKNKEETIRVQTESLAVAEARIAVLTVRANDLRKEVDRKTKEYQTLSKSLESCKVEKNDVWLLTDKQMEDQNDIVSTLQNNLCVIEDLYRECFYETAKQESLIDMLRTSYLDVRVMDKQKAHHIGRLQTAINTQKWSLDKCQDIALEVDNLKMDISNFLSSSTSTNNDSGMWERSEESFAAAPGVQDELQDIVEQLVRLQDLLSTECTCGLREENTRLKQKIEDLDLQIGQLRRRICELECNLTAKESTDQKKQTEIEEKEKELLNIREQLAALEEGSRDQSSTCDTLTVQLRHTQALLDEKTTELVQVQQVNESQLNALKELGVQLEKADQLIKENCKMRSEVSFLTAQVKLWRTQLTDSERRVRVLENDLQSAREQCTQMEAYYREKASSVSELQAQLEAAHARGAALCGDTRRAVGTVRTWMRRMREKHREQEHMIKAKDVLLTNLQQRLEERRNDSQRTSASENTPTCSKCLSSRDERSFCSKIGARREQSRGPSTSEMASCSSTPVPPIRLRKKPCGNRRCKAWMCDAAIQEPIRRNASAETSRPSLTPCPSPPCASPPPCCGQHDVRHVRVRLDRAPRDVSPTEELFLRVEQLSEALADGHRRWTRPHDAR